ncbi:lipopolysaccharide biosynthesis protein [Aliagarivorans taiwanensis]|uniref:lipopolysaccharide biosynthesis protein n=1 Tax=Aliagarivorans taiwanensis TaxID=561966 RepID=UPI0003F5B6CB|nr:oligosaccharide flippase family protein [Aliagarivorans taiwanensis]
MKQANVKSLPVYFIGSVLRQLVGFIMLPIYTSVLTPADYGVIGLLAISLSIFETALGGRFAQAVPKFYFERDNDSKRRLVLSSSFLFTLFISSLSAMLFFSLSAQLSQAVLGDSSFELYFKWYSLLLITSGVEAYGLTYLRLLDRAWSFITVSLLKLVFQLATNIYFVVYLRMGVEGVVYAQVLVSGLFALVFAGVILTKVGWGIESPLIARLFAFCWPLWLTGLAGLYISSANRYFVRLYAGLDEVGLFAIVIKFASLLTPFVWTPFSQWWQTERFRVYKTNQGRDVYPHVFNLISFTLIMFALGICLFSDPVIQLMSAPAFHAAASGIAIMTVGRLVGQVSMFFNTAYLVKEKTAVIAKLRYAFAAIATVGFVVLIPRYGFIGACMAMCLSQIIMFIINYHLSRKYSDMGISLNIALALLAVLILAVLVDYVFIPQALSWQSLLAKALLFLCGLVAGGAILFSKYGISGVKMVVSRLKMRAAAKQG